MDWLEVASIALALVATVLHGAEIITRKIQNERLRRNDKSEGGGVDR